MFTREFLKKLAKESAIELPKEFEDSIINKHLEARDGYAEQQLEPLKNEIDELKETNKSNEPGKEVDIEKSKEYLALKKQFDDYKEEISSKEINEGKLSTLKAALKENGANESFIDRMVKGFDLSKVEIVEGKIKESEKVIDEFKGGDWKDVFGEIKTKPANIDTPPGSKNGESDPFLKGFGD